MEGIELRLAQVELMLSELTAGDEGGWMGAPMGGIGGGGIVAGDEDYKKPFDIEFGEDGKISKVGRGYVNVGGRTLGVSETEVSGENGFVCVETDGHAAMVEFYPDYDKEQKDLDKIVIPIYEIREGQVEMDMRLMPYTGMIEDTEEEEEG